MMQTLSIIGAGAFGAFMLRHVAPFFKVRIYDPHVDTQSLGALYNIDVCESLQQAAEADIVIIAVPVPFIEGVCKELAPLLKAGQLVMDVGSVKVLPAKVMQEHLPADVDLIGLHPLFGPQSGKYSIHGLNIAVVNIRGERAAGVSAFLADQLHLNVVECSADEHDQQMAYVQGLTHMIARVFQNMDVPEIKQETNTFRLLHEMVGLVKNDSDELFKAIQTDNPYVQETKDKFFSAVSALEDSLK